MKRPPSPVPVYRVEVHYDFGVTHIVETKTPITDPEVAYLFAQCESLKWGVTYARSSAEEWSMQYSLMELPTPKYYTLEVLCTCWIREHVWRCPKTGTSMELAEALREARKLAKEEHCIEITVQVDGNPVRVYSGPRIERKAVIL